MITVPTIPFVLMIIVLSTVTPLGNAGAQVIAGAECKPGPTRITDRDWHGYLFISPNVSIEEATSIIRALRNGDYENKLPWPSEGPRVGIAPVLPFIDANQIRSINVERDGGKRMFVLRTGCMSGTLYQVVIVNGKLELHSVHFWIA